MYFIFFTWNYYIDDIYDNNLHCYMLIGFRDLKLYTVYMIESMSMSLNVIRSLKCFYPPVSLFLGKLNFSEFDSLDNSKSI